jgi:hypothetical protein
MNVSRPYEDPLIILALGTWHKKHLACKAFTIVVNKQQRLRAASTAETKQAPIRSKHSFLCIWQAKIEELKSSRTVGRRLSDRNVCSTK